jgi:hypothetical protein
MVRFCDLWHGGENAIPFHTQHDAALGEGNSTLLLKACLRWVDAQFNINRKSLQEIMANSDFQQILELHRQMEVLGHPNVVSGYIFELASFTQQSCLMVPYVYICRTVPTRFSRTEIGLLGYGRSLPEMMKQLGYFDRFNLESALSEPRSLAILDGKKVAADSHQSGLTGISSDSNISLAEQVAKKSDIPSMHHATGSFRELGAMPHVETSALDGQQMNYSYICKHCKRPADTISLASKQGPFHADDCPRFLHF